MKRLFLSACTAGLVLASSSSFANDYLTSDSFSNDKDLILKEAALQMSEVDKVLAKQWMLEDTDWIKYKEIMSGPRGIWSPGLDPLTALGVSETDPQERKRYAELWMKMEIRRVELELAFEVERQKAGKRIQGDLLAVNNQAWIDQWEQEQQAITHQVMFFVDAACSEDCKDQFDNLYKSIGNNAKLDIYFKDGIGSEDIGVWAAFMGINPDVVRSKKVTLNFDSGRSQKMYVSEESIPAVRVLDIKSGQVTDSYKD
jgi:integrating conjugative element protein (TIGR03759 family)